MQTFDSNGRQAFYDFWDDMTRRCTMVEYVETKTDANGRQQGRKIERKVKLEKAWIKGEVQSNDGGHYAAVGFGDRRIHIGLKRFGHLTGPGPFVRSKPDTAVLYELKKWSAHFTCEGEDFTILATINFC